MTLAKDPKAKEDEENKHSTRNKRIQTQEFSTLVQTRTQNAK
jgi:hypothetical protein